MTTISRKLRGTESVVFAPPVAEDHPLKIAQFRAWRVKEPVSDRRYTVVRLQSLGGVSGYGEGGSASAAEIAAAQMATLGPARDRIRIHSLALRRTPSLEAAVNNATPDLVAAPKTCRSIAIWADRSGTRRASSAIWRAPRLRTPVHRSNAPNARGFRPSLSPRHSAQL